MKHKKFSELDFSDRFTYKKNIVFNENELDCKGTKFQIVNFPPHSTLAPHYHKKTTEIFFIWEGKGILKINDRRFRCTKGDIFLCEKEDVHAIENSNNKEFSLLIFKTNEIKNDIYWL